MKVVCIKWEINEYDSTLKILNFYFSPVVSVMTREITVGGAKKEAQIKNTYFW